MAGDVPLVVAARVATTPQLKLAEFEAVVVGNLNGNDNNVRMQAEHVLLQMKQSNPEMFMVGLLALLKESKLDEVRQFAAVILRQHLLVNSSSPVWNNCSAGARKQIQDGLLWLFTHEPTHALRRKITDAVAATATRITGKAMVDMSTDEHGVARTAYGAKIDPLAAQTPASEDVPWPELMPTVLSLANTVEARQSLCDLINKLGEFSPSILLPHLRQCKDIIVAGMKDSQMPVRLSGLRACVSVLRDLAEGDREHMKDTVPLMFGILETAFSTGDDETIVHAVTTLTDLAEVNNEGESDTGVAGGARFLRGHIQPILQAMATMAASSKLEPETRRVCFNFLILLAEVGKGMIRKQKEFAQRVIPLAFSFLTELQHSAAWESPTKVEEGDDDEDYENYKFGAQSMERLSHALGGKLTMSISKPIIDAALRDTNNWTLRHAALIAMSKIAMGCQKELGPHLNEIMANYVTAMALNDPNPRVQWAAIDLCGHLCEAFEPDFPNDQSEAIIQTLLACMQPQQHWRVIENACACLPEVGRTIDPEKLVPCMEHLLRALVPLLGMMQYPKVVERALGAVSTVAAVSHKAFIPYYDSFMPGVKGIIVSCTEAHQVRIRTRAIECIGMLAQAVEGEKFRPELDAIMQALLGMLAQGMPSDDPQHGEIVTTMARIARSVKQEFLPYLPQILPSIFKSARIDDACVIVNEGEANPYAGRNGWETVNVEARAVGKQTVSINTTLLEEKARAIRMLFEYCNTLGASFYPYAQDMANIVVPCLRYQHNQNVRENCTFALRPLMLCFKEALKNDPAAQQTQCSALFAFLWPQVILCMKVENDVELLGDLCQAMQEVIEIYTPYRLSGEHIKELNQLLYRLVGELLVRCRHRSDHQESEDFDEAQAELYEMENEAEDEFLGKVYGLVNALVKNGKEAYLESFHAELYEIYNAMRKSEDVSLRTNAICVFSQVMEDCPQHPLTRQYCDDLYATCVESVCDEDIPLRQSAVFGIGVCAMVLGTAFASQAEQTMKSLAAIAADESLGDDADVVTDNAISAMAKIFTYVYNSGVSAANVPPCPQSVLQIMSKWVSFLPCDGDVLEAQKIHEQLTQYIGANNPTVLGDGFRNLPIILGVFGKIFGLENWEDVCLPETHAKMVAIFQQLQKEMPIEQLRAMVHEMKPEMKAAYAPYVINQALLQ